MNAAMLDSLVGLGWERPRLELVALPSMWRDEEDKHKIMTTLPAALITTGALVDTRKHRDWREWVTTWDAICGLAGATLLVLTAIN